MHISHSDNITPPPGGNSASNAAPQRPGLIYHETRFRLPRPVLSWPSTFGLITGYATTGEVWPEERNQQANAALERVLVSTGCWMAPITGYSPSTGHAEPGWAVEMTFEQCCKLGEEFLQDAIYFVENGELFVSPCAEGKRDLAPVGNFMERVDPPAPSPDSA